MKKKKFIIITISVLATCSIILGGSYYMGKLVYDSSVGSPQTVLEEEIVAVYGSREGKPLDKLDEYKHTNIMIESPENGYDVQAKFIECPTKSKDTVILVHGIGSNYNEYIFYADEYLKKGYNVMLYNQRNTSQTGGDNYTFGLYERFDLDSVVNHVNLQMPDGKIIVQGFSMGAATTAMHSELNEKNKLVDLYIIEGPYSNMDDAIELGIIAENIPVIPTSYIKHWGNIYTKMNDGFGYDEVKPYEAVQEITTPMMIIHGLLDDVCAPENSQEIFDNIPHDKKELWFIEDSAHIKAWDDTGDEYFKRIFKFIDTHLK